MMMLAPAFHERSPSPGGARPLARGLRLYQVEVIGPIRLQGNSAGGSGQRSGTRARAAVWISIPPPFASLKASIRARMGSSFFFMACSSVRAAPSLLACPFLPPAAAVYVEHRFGLGIREGCEVDLDGDFAPAFLTGQRQVGLLPVVGEIGRAHV